jgi:hypothetical protein
MKKRTTFAGWLARIFCIAAIIFVSMFALDALEQGTFFQKLSAFALHLIPSFTLVLALLIAWKYELAGGILFILIGLCTAPFIYHFNFERTHSALVCCEVLSMINLPFIIVGVMFTYSYYRLKKMQAH